MTKSSPFLKPADGAPMTTTDMVTAIIVLSVDGRWL